MGVEGFQSFVRKQFRNHHTRSWFDLRTRLGRHVRRLYIDLNALMHIALQRVMKTLSEEDRIRWKRNLSREFWPEIFNQLVKEIDDVVELIRPTVELHLEADGVVVKAKITQQRRRAYQAKESSRPEPFIRSQIKPGTDFMLDLTTHIERAMARKHGKGFYPPRIRFSSASIPGEGEHKIMEDLMNLDNLPRNSVNNGIDVIYGPDSDLQILGLIKQPRPSQPVTTRELQRLLRELESEKKELETEELEGEFENADDINNINNQIKNTKILLSKIQRGMKITLTQLIVMREQHNWSSDQVDKKGRERSQWEFFDINGIREQINRELGNVEDFILLTYLVGNDFVPNIPDCRQHTQALSQMYETYKQVFGEQKGRNRIPEFIPQIAVKGRTLSIQGLLKFLRGFRFKAEEMLDIDYQLVGAVKQFKDNFERTIPNIPVERESEPHINALVKEKKKGEEKVNGFVFAETWKRHIFGIYDATLLTDANPDITSINKDATEELVHNWVAGLNWTWQYYNKVFININMNWAYTYTYGPSVEMIIKVLEQDLASGNMKWINQSLDIIIVPEIRRMRKVKIKVRNEDGKMEEKTEERMVVIRSVGEDQRRRKINQEKIKKLVHPFVQLAAILPVTELKIIPDKLYVKDLLRLLPDLYPNPNLFYQGSPENNGVVIDMDLVPDVLRTVETDDGTIQKLVPQLHTAKILIPIPSLARITSVYEGTHIFLKEDIDKGRKIPYSGREKNITNNKIRSIRSWGFRGKGKVKSGKGKGGKKKPISRKRVISEGINVWNKRLANLQLEGTEIITAKYLTEKQTVNMFSGDIVWNKRPFYIKFDNGDNFVIFVDKDGSAPGSVIWVKSNEDTIKFSPKGKRDNQKTVKSLNSVGKELVGLYIIEIRYMKKKEWEIEELDRSSVVIFLSDDSFLYFTNRLATKAGFVSYIQDKEDADTIFPPI